MRLPRVWFSALHPNRLTGSVRLSPCRLITDHAAPTLHRRGSFCSAPDKDHPSFGCLFPSPTEPEPKHRTFNIQHPTSNESLVTTLDVGCSMFPAENRRCSNPPVTCNPDNLRENDRLFPIRPQRAVGRGFQRCGALRTDAPYPFLV